MINKIKNECNKYFVYVSAKTSIDYILLILLILFGSTLGNDDIKSKIVPIRLQHTVVFTYYRSSRVSRFPRSVVSCNFWISTAPAYEENVVWNLYTFIVLTEILCNWKTSMMFRVHQIIVLILNCYSIILNVYLQKKVHMKI